jgi:GNAT superfamily N-acetyltransferase
VPPAGVTVRDERPPEEELVALYTAVGWTAYSRDPAVLVQAVAGSACVLAARSPDAQLVGLSRALTDDAVVVYIQDVLVHPGWQRRGVGRALLTAVLDRYRGLRQRVLLSDDAPGQRAFYEALGFREIRDHAAGHLRAFVMIS